jgi:hypothetical protein
MRRPSELSVVLAIFGVCLAAAPIDAWALAMPRGMPQVGLPVVATASTETPRRGVDVRPTSAPASAETDRSSQPAPGSIAISSPIDLKSACQAASCGTGVHGGTQSRICHTSHGAYAAYLAEDNKGGMLFHVVRIREGKAALLKTASTALAGSNSVHVLCDAREEVYVVAPATVSVNGKERASLGLYHIDRKTDAVTDYHAEIPFEHGVSFGYSSACIDTVRNRVYAVYSGGDAPGYFAWFTFDLNTMAWLPAGTVIDLKYRHCYNYCFTDGRGGMAILSERDITNEAAGITKADTNRKINANYVWDELRLFYIDDLSAARYEAVDVEKAVYDKPAGLYPTVQNNYRGDTFVDVRGNLHVLYLSDDNNGVRGAVLRHAVYDARRILIRNEPLEFQGEYMMRMAQAIDGTHYIIAMPYKETARVEIWQATDADGRHYKLQMKSQLPLDVAPTYAGLAVSCPRNGSLRDNVIDCLFPVNQTYYYFSIALGPPKAMLKKDR